ncbi:Nucleolar RNA helicase II (macronuclear) [Paramecium tetraurelia strain d4-2]|uniref:RNA helicase n=1 Tax=Paramecium tetraurelia TaxID=5888 RepID=Q6BFH3_PARTE|nr:Nucleolar RNA helicase II [Paramecium tetraurelia strain d4-2]CAH03597.1 Nucleolar RNA helicase II, putative [Paramecium tetraurelia]
MLTRRKSSELIEPEIVKKVKGIDESNLKAYIKNKQTRKVLEGRGISNLFPIQQQCFETIYNGDDIIGQDRTGSGKTLAYCLPILERIRGLGLKQNKNPYVLVLLPTRELAIQVTTEFNTILHKENEYRIYSIYGGTDLRNQIDQVRQGCEIVVGTPGRIQDLLERKVLKLDEIQVVVLDEADQMLNFGFQENIEKIMSYFNERKIQMLLFSATIPDWVKELSHKYMEANTKHINLIKRHETQTSTTVKHYALQCARNQLSGAIGDVVSVYGGRHARTIIFCETKRECNEIILHSKLPAETQPLHGDIPQQQRTVTFEGFKNGKFKCLVATNVAARGLDFPQVDLIIQCNPPKDIESYIHRSGRTGRAGKDGVCITFYSKKDMGLIERVERVAKIKFIKISAPQHQDIIKASSRDLQTSLQVVSKEIVDMFQPVAQEIISRCDPVEALARALACVSGYKDKLQNRSMLGSFEGYITYVLRSSTPFQACGYIWKFLKNNFSEQICNSIKGMKKIRNENGVAFDISEDVKEEFENQYQEISQNGYCRGIEIEQATSLPDIIEEQFQSHQNYHQQPTVQVSQTVKKEQEIFIGGLDFKITEDEIKNEFKNRGVELFNLRLLRGQDGQSKGSAFGVCRTKEMVSVAIKQNGTKFRGRNVRVNMANEKPK